MPRRSSILEDAQMSIADLEDSHSEILSRIAAELRGAGPQAGHSSHSSSSGGGHYSYASATGPSKAQSDMAKKE